MVELHFVDEGRKRVLLIAAGILAARNLMNWDGWPSLPVECPIADVIALAARVLVKIDAWWPERAGFDDVRHDKNRSS